MLIAALAACSSPSLEPSPSASRDRASVTWAVEWSDLRPAEVRIIVDGKSILVGQMSDVVDGDSCRLSSNTLTCGSERGHEEFELTLENGAFEVTGRTSIHGQLEQAKQHIASIPTSAHAFDLGEFDGSHPQTFRTALVALCRAPAEVPAELEGQARANAIAKNVDSAVTDPAVRALFARLGTVDADAKRLELATALHRANLVQCRYLDTIPKSTYAKSIRRWCTDETDLMCPDGYEVGCDDRLRYLACVRNGARATASCTDGPTLTCGPDEIDSCAASPPFGDRHICVLGSA